LLQTLLADTRSVLRAQGISEKGHVRPVNEDCLAIDEARGLLVVADGMGGHNAGEVAARIAVETIVSFIAAGHAEELPFGDDAALTDAGNRLRTAIHLANAQILERASGFDAYAGMGTTIVAVIVAGNRMTVGHVGDSRLYVLANDRIRQVTHDDSWIASMLAHDPAADAAALRHHPMRGALTSVVGGRRRTDVHIAEEALAGGESLLLSTDGVHDVLDDRRLEHLMSDRRDVGRTAANIVAAALARGSRDNCTALVAQYFRG
jgi:protein phosphatase